MLQCSSQLTAPSREERASCSSLRASCSSSCKPSFSASSSISCLETLVTEGTEGYIPLSNNLNQTLTYTVDSHYGEYLNQEGNHAAISPSTSPPIIEHTYSWSGSRRGWSLIQHALDERWEYTLDRLPIHHKAHTLDHTERHRPGFEPRIFCL